MIKFFRQIRSKSMEDNKTSRYFKYAIGEIILVVIGILIALQINNWNEARKARASEINYLKNLKADLSSEIENTKNFADYRYAKAKSASLLLNSEAPNSMEDVENYTNTYEQVFIWHVYVPNNNTFKELLSSGNLSLIKNEAIKNKLLELDKQYSNIATGEEHMRREYETYLYDPHVTNIRALGFFDLKEPAYGFPKRLSIDDIPETQHQKMIDDAKWQHKDPLFQNGLRLAMMNNGFLAGMHKDLANFLKDTIAIIETEIAL